MWFRQWSVSDTASGWHLMGSGVWGPLGRRLLAAFLIVALSSVAVITIAALIGVDRSARASDAAEREQVAIQTSAAVAAAYSRAGTWESADLDSARAVAESVGANLAVLDSTGQVVVPGGPGSPSGRGPSRNAVSANVVVDGEVVGSVRLGFGPKNRTDATGISVRWIVTSAVVSILLAVMAAILVTDRITRPLARVTEAARRFAAGDRTARSEIRPPGELGDLARAFDETADEVVRSEQSRRDLSADVAHELRTPLAAMTAGLEELRDGLVPAEPAVLTGLHDQASRMGRVVDDLALLSAAEVAGPTLRRTEVKLKELVTTELLLREPQLHAAGLTVTTDLGDVVITADADRLHQVLGNLLVNAARYCGPGDSVRIRCARDDGWALLEVSDNGPGIPAEDLPHIFDRFWRGGTSGTVGSGLGLPIVRALVLAHGGRIGVRSDGVTGTTFTVRLPTDVVPATHKSASIQR